MANPLTQLFDNPFGGRRPRYSNFETINLTCRYCGSAITAEGASAHWRAVHRGRISYSGERMR